MATPGIDSVSEEYTWLDLGSPGTNRGPRDI